ncbi:MAG: hypothetical protein M1150_01675 [Patescibacteria group bacterium]|nr:hypothetical protein [Patescibacteria group bacterium]
MEILAPTPEDTQAAIISTLSSQNRPFLFILIFTVSLLVIHFVFKKGFKISILASLFITFLIAIYIIQNYLSRLRY